MTLPKFIVTMDGHLRMGMVSQHKHLLKAGDQCIGGGIILDRESYDFGRPRWHLLSTLLVPAAYRGLSIVYQYDDYFHDDFRVSDELTIAYEEE